MGDELGERAERASRGLRGSQRAFNVLGLLCLVVSAVAGLALMSMPVGVVASATGAWAVASGIVTAIGCLAVGSVLGGLAVIVDLLARERQGSA